jgi:hypothetical protein
MIWSRDFFFIFKSKRKRDNMPISYENFRGDTYYLHCKKNKKGTTTYHFSKDPKEAADIEEIPNGLEIYEEPNGKVYLKKKVKQYIHAEEIQTIKNGIRKYSEIDDFRLDIKKHVIFIYTVPNPCEDVPIPEHLINKYKQYDTQLRFVLVDEDERRFEVERFCYLGSVDDWIYLDASTDLETLVREYTQHLGKKSLYDLF